MSILKTYTCVKCSTGYQLYLGGMINIEYICITYSVAQLDFAQSQTYTLYFSFRICLFVPDKTTFWLKPIILSSFTIVYSTTILIYNVQIIKEFSKSVIKFQYHYFPINL